MRWIEISERLPEIHQDVLIWKKGWVVLAAYLDDDDDGNLWFIHYNNCGLEQIPVAEITHWMPMPKNPEANEMD
jgi:hypothetical protein